MRLLTAELLLSILAIRVGRWAGFWPTLALGYIGVVFGVAATFALMIGYSWLIIRSFWRRAR